MMHGTFERVLDANELRDSASRLLDNGGRMQMAWAWFQPSGGVEVCYLSAPGPRQPLELWRCPAPSGHLPSLAGLIPLLGWYEREITDLCGVRFVGHPEPRPLLFEGLDFAPLNPANKDAPTPTNIRAPTFIPEVAGSDAQQLPFGPVRAGVVESAQFEFLYLGEHILRYAPRLFFKHRGMEKRFEGLAPAAGATLAERVSGIGSVAHALAYCQAVEAAAQCTVPPRARRLRVVLAELERLYNHLHYFAHLADTTTLKVGHAEGALLEERIKQLAARLTGSRLLRNLLIPGGLRRDLAMPAGFGEQLDALEKQARYYLDQLDRTTSYLDRLITTGPLQYKVAFDQGATGPVERASGLDRDMRRDHPYAAYDELELHPPVRDDGDAYARAHVRASEIIESFSILRQILTALQPGEVRAECTAAADTEGLGWAESPRGSLYYAVHLDGSARLARVKIKSPSYSNWRVFPFTVHDTNMMDYAINEASFGLSVAGCDR